MFFTKKNFHLISFKIHSKFQIPFAKNTFFYRILSLQIKMLQQLLNYVSLNTPHSYSPRGDQMLPPAYHSGVT